IASRLTCVVWTFIIQVNSMSYAPGKVETIPATRLDRWVDPSLSSRSDEVANEGAFEGTAGSAPSNQELGESRCARPESRAVAFALSRPPTPNDRIGWPGSGCGGEEGMEAVGEMK